ncbi:DUF3581 domain-containing protein [Psychromonas sp. 14N.309.X.WAT.B.A12]|uniref:DUF3581 domain-containing protein n=1 Tax=Psychromonas sp. 14N.309.X.WAT.B.A12 TaxID=2998322 RepID=UPI0025B16457|nr:DUF3581 domain-containing protein [Psychromonas sp. 14N.309.X.WAT.B.A12]MDN2663748.1 DUF3581 domain-containing protein [Psychromonas sp. 14N.309.X.WAT.B.A12]
MLLDPYYIQQDSNITISAEQASIFAKKECQDFNPIHDPDSKRFCVPGDLLFSLALKEYGVSKSMSFTFTNMVGDNIPLTFPEATSDDIIVTNAQGKSVLEISKSGEMTRDLDLIESLIKNYVVFSGQNFPALLMPLMKKHQVMFNPARPLVMYNSMSFEFDSLTLTNPLRVELAESKLEVESKRANEFLHFDIYDGDKIIGRGIKTVVVGGLKPYDHDAITAFADNYLANRNAF